jgi:tRNA A-37 threonylcarbamoyl transferase component Bud32
MAADQKCPECGAPLPPDAPLGVCPKCVLGLMIGKPGDTAEIAPTADLQGYVFPEKRALSALFPQLEIFDVVGRGGMGIVYKARQIKLDRLVALKLIRPESADNPHFAERFLREARAMARLQHPSIVTIFDFGEVDGLFYLIMEFVDGGDLRQSLAKGRLKEEAALITALQVCDALRYAHEQGVIHRDIKPENILRTSAGQVKIADFGLAKLLQPSGVAPLTMTRQVMGTPHYMAPEQLERPREADHRADIYSLGVVIYEIFTGELPLGRYELPSEKIGVDEQLDDIVAKATARNPNDRYAKIEKLRDDLNAFAEDYDLSKGWQALGVRGQSAEVAGNAGDGGGWFLWTWFWLIFPAVYVAWPLLSRLGYAALEFLTKTRAVPLDSLPRVTSVLVAPWAIVFGVVASTVGALIWWRARRNKSVPEMDKNSRAGAAPGEGPNKTSEVLLKLGPAEAKIMGTILAVFLLALLGLTLATAFLVQSILARRGWEGPVSIVVALGMLTCVLGGLLSVFWNGIGRRGDWATPADVALSASNLGPSHFPNVDANSTDFLSALKSLDHPTTLQEVRRPAIGLLFVGVLYAAVGAASLIALGMRLAALVVDGQPLTSVISVRGVVGALCAVLASLLGVVSVHAGLQAAKLRSRPLALLVCVLLIVLLTPFSPIAMPVGIWGVVVFTRPRSAAAFRLLEFNDPNTVAKPVGHRASAIDGVSSV